MKSLTVLLMATFISLSALGQDHYDTTFIYFDFDKHQVREDEQRKLEIFLTAYTNGEITGSVLIKGFCDIKGSDNYNDLLSRKRSFAVHEFLLNNGFPKTSVSLIKGYGERIPVNENLTDEERQLNRRVELIWMPATVVDTVVTEIENTDPPPPPPQQTISPVQDFSKTMIDSVQVGTVLRLRNINFYGGRHTLLPVAYAPLEELLQVMRENPTLEIEIQGHICCRPGSPIDGADFDAGDNNLSLNRAKAVYSYLVENGIAKKRMTFRGYAGAIPRVYPEYTEADRTANRRVEVKILKK